MFERFTERARQVVVLAKDEARGLKHNEVDAEHILLGLLREEDGLGSVVLRNMGLSVDSVRGRVVEIVVPGDTLSPHAAPFTQRAKGALENSLREALRLGHNYVGTEHLLLGLSRVEDGVVPVILSDSGLDYEAIRNEIVRILTGTHTQPVDAGVVRAKAMMAIAQEAIDRYTEPFLKEAAVELYRLTVELYAAAERNKAA